MLQLIPFGLKIENNAYVDVSDVPKGRSCGCICPSCSTPLIARQGTKKEWHFAHASRKVEGTDKDCEFSFYVSVRMMARQLFESGFKIELPSFEETIKKIVGENIYEEKFTITKPSSIQLEQVTKETTFNHCMVDIIGAVRDFSLIIYFTHPSRPLPTELLTLNNDKVGVVEIKLNETHDLFIHNKSSDRQVDKLRNYLQSDLKSKRWVFHPRKEKCQKVAKEKIENQISKRKFLYSNEPKKKNEPQRHFVTNNSVKYECVLCRCQWLETGGKPTCTKCKSHLYATKV